jgi:hypothetical protein
MATGENIGLEEINANDITPCRNWWAPQSLKLTRGGRKFLKQKSHSYCVTSLSVSSCVPALCKSERCSTLRYVALRVRSRKVGEWNTTFEESTSCAQSSIMHRHHCSSIPLHLCLIYLCHYRLIVLFLSLFFSDFVFSPSFSFLLPFSVRPLSHICLRICKT